MTALPADTKSISWLSAGTHSSNALSSRLLVQCFDARPIRLADQELGHSSDEIDQDGLLTTVSHVARTRLPSKRMQIVCPIGMLCPL